MYIKVKKNLFINCAETSELISLSRDNKVGLWRKMQIRMHLSMCDACTRFERFVHKTGDVLKSSPAKAEMPDALRKKIKRKMAG